ncbi:trehalase family glycosidase [Pseudoalteromonas tunicata]|jgi:alpha,alpha-trehalase|uniref:Trehalase n=1 Tax=Pseudoalteromonas tunicata D2 TaxID=87626 RepID=A4C9Y9_9GAMM|nr:trehalase family glycosidase [Pseudoalteromonas tunicata]ATC94747.1 alpha,alpha-trehalase [Pseudoalteromonas tunicata]AXT30451.1 alpha,alpha-trehalase [Pseudoalteromonas tunicata]EAR28197.1 trehalase [Pseudoalteromonas tunicata D2]
MNFVNSQLFLDVQLAGLFADSKTFADAEAKHSWQHACALYLAKAPLQGADLAQFVAEEFTFKCAELPNQQLNTTSVKDYIESLWPHLHRPADNAKSSSLLPLQHSYIVPGGRFQEIYYWDSYFTSLGLEDMGDIDSIEDMLMNFIDLQNRNGCIPNGNRSYYSSRSQPPILALMVDLVWQAKYRNKADFDWLAQCANALEQEHRFWMQGHDELNPDNTSHRRIVRMANGALLNRYWDDEATARPESLREDLHDSALLAQAQREQYFRNIRAACESGWDFSSRWLADGTTLLSIQTTDIIPIDLNCLLYQLEYQLAEYFAVLKRPEKQSYFNQLAASRNKAINHYLWHNELNFFVDYNHKLGLQSEVLSLAGVVPLFVQLATHQQALHVNRKIMAEFLKPGGLVTTLNKTAQQWDSPNGWAPLQWFAVQGFNYYGFNADAQTIIARWLTMIEANFATDHCLLEKYNVCDPAHRAGGGEYKVQQGFGWTNGVTARFYKLTEQINA